LLKKEGIRHSKAKLLYFLVRKSMIQTCLVKHKLPTKKLYTPTQKQFMNEKLSRWAFDIWNFNRLL